MPTSIILIVVCMVTDFFLRLHLDPSVTFASSLLAYNMPCTSLIPHIPPVHREGLLATGVATFESYTVWYLHAAVVSYRATCLLPYGGSLYGSLVSPLQPQSGTPVVGSTGKISWVSRSTFRNLPVPVYVSWSWRGAAGWWGITS